MACGGVAACGSAVSRGIAGSIFPTTIGKLLEYEVIRRGKLFALNLPILSNSMQHTPCFERSVVVPLPGMLLARELFDTVGLGDALVGNASAVDAHLGETAVRSAASVEEVVDLLVSGIRERHPGRKVILVGHSYGSYAALEFARRAPNLLSGLVLISSQLRAETKRTTARRWSRVQFAHSNGITALIDELIPALLSSKSIADANKVKAVYRMAEDIGVETFAKQMRACIGRSDQQSSLSALHPSLPVFVAAGAQDKLIPSKCLHEMRKGLQDRERDCLAKAYVPAPWTVCSHANVGHLMPLEDPDSLHVNLSSWAASVRCFAASVNKQARTPNVLLNNPV